MSPECMLTPSECMSWNADLRYAERDIRHKDFNKLTPCMVVVPNTPVTNIAGKKA
jgi:hypothetical protein